MTPVERYRGLIELLVADPPPFLATRESADVVQVERGTELAGRLAGRRVDAALPPLRCDVVDAAGHRRPVYRPLLVYAHLRAGTVANVAVWVASLQPDVNVPLTAAAGARTAAAAWAALALHVAGTPGPAADLFRRLVDSQQENDTFLRTTPSDSPETHWFHELVVLHAVANFALVVGDSTAWRAVERAAEFHLNETEPDHATGQPWGLPAFVRIPAAAPLADALLHAVSAHQPTGPTGVPLLLLADTLYGLRRTPAGPVPPAMEDRT